MVLGAASPGPRPRLRHPTPSQALDNISEASPSDAEHFAVYLLPNAGIWEPAEREIRTKCGGGLDRNSGPLPLEDDGALGLPGSRSALVTRQTSVEEKRAGSP